MTEVKEENEQRRRDKHIKEGSEIKRWKGRNEASIGVLSQDHFKKMTAYQIPLLPAHHLQCFILPVSSVFFYFLSLSSLQLAFLSYFSCAQPPSFFSHHINDREDDTEAHHLYLSLRLRPPKIRNSPLIWNKWPSSGKPKPPDSAAWFIKGAWSRKLVQPQQKAKALSTCYTKLKVRS